MSIMTGLSGNEMYCLHLKGLSPGELVVGNSVYSLGFVGGRHSSCPQRERIEFASGCT